MFSSLLQAEVECVAHRFNKARSEIAARPEAPITTKAISYREITNVTCAGVDISTICSQCQVSPAPQSVKRNLAAETVLDRRRVVNCPPLSLVPIVADLGSVDGLSVCARVRARATHVTGCAYYRLELSRHCPRSCAT